MALVALDFLRSALAAPVAIMGAGASGRGVQALLAKLGASGVIFDEKLTGEGIVNNFTAVSAFRHALVVFSPGFSPVHPWLEKARASGATCLGELDFASLFWRGQVIAITGTNGKTTLTEFLTHALREMGDEAYATGNIGYSFSQLVVDTDGGVAGAVAVCEASSFQAETLCHLRPDATLWTNFAEDHLERHPGMKAYFAAKWNLVARTAPGSFFAGTSVQDFAQASGRAVAASARVISEVKSASATLDGTVFARQPQLENYLLAAAWWRGSGRDESALEQAAKTFQLGRHRLARIAEKDGVTWWNDSKATNFHAAEAAINRFSSPVLVILGGKSKGGDLSGFVRRIAPKVKKAFLLGETKAELETYCAASGVDFVACKTLAETVSQSAKYARPGDQVLLSPGFASFDLFRNYQDRGDQFESLVNNLGVSPNLG